MGHCWGERVCGVRWDTVVRESVRCEMGHCCGEGESVQCEMGHCWGERVWCEMGHCWGERVRRAWMCGRLSAAPLLQSSCIYGPKLALRCEAHWGVPVGEFSFFSWVMRPASSLRRVAFAFSGHATLTHKTRVAPGRQRCTFVDVMNDDYPFWTYLLQLTLTDQSQSFVTLVNS